MKTLLSILTVFGLVISQPIYAQCSKADGDCEKKKEQKGDHSKRKQEFHQKMLEKFDKDGDGKLSEDERGEAKKILRGKTQSQT